MTEKLIEDEKQGVISDDFLADIKEALADNDGDHIAQLTDLLVPADMGLLFDRLTNENRIKLFSFIEKTFDPELLTNLSPSAFKSIVSHISIRRLASLLPELDSDDAFYVFEELDEQQQRRLLKSIPAENRSNFEKILTYPEDSAARIMQQEVVIAPSFWTIEALIRFVQESENIPENFYEVYVVNPRHEPIGRVSVNLLIRHEGKKKLSDIMDEDVRAIPASENQEEVAYAFRHYDLVSAPVVDEANRIIGMITSDDVVDVIDEEAQKEITQITGISHSDLSAPVLLMSYHRMAGLMVTFVNSFIVIFVLSQFENVIKTKAGLAALLPIVSGMSGASGTQILALTVRALATKMLSPANTFKTVTRELLISSINGIVFSLILMAFIILWYNDLFLGLVLIVSLTFTMLWAAFSGVVLPIVVDRLGLDPAINTGPLLSALTDVIGFLSVLALATAML